MSSRLDTQSIGLDVGLSFVKWLTGAENLHYGLWTGLEVNASNLRAAQEAYTEKLFRLLPVAPSRILDIGGGAGETAKKLIALGHDVDIVVPSAFLAERCRLNAPTARVHQCRFEDFVSETRFDICLFSESFQYIPVDIALDKCLKYLAADGEIVISDCFRRETYIKPETDIRPIVGGGHILSRYLRLRDERGFQTVSEEDITNAVAPSIDLEQSLFNVFGHGLARVDAELLEKRPKTRWIIQRALSLFMKQRSRRRLNERLRLQNRNARIFQDYNQYLMIKLRPAP